MWLLIGFWGLVGLFALPPLDPAELRSDSQVIITGTVESYYDRLVPIGTAKADSNRDILLVVTVDDVEKGTGVTVGELVYLHAWQAAQRPDGWVGDGGQRDVPSAGQRARFFLKKKAGGRLSLLSPNGSEIMSAAKQK